VGADSVTTLQAQAASVAQQLVRQQLESDAYQQQYSVASARVAADDQAIAAIDQQIGTDEQAITARSSEVRTQAVRSYIDGGAQSAGTSFLTGSADRAQAASEYQSIAVGNINTQLDRYRTAQRSLQADRATLQAREAEDRAGRDTQASALSQADTATQQLAAVHARVTGQLATAVAAAQVAQARSAAAAVTAAQQAAVGSQPAASASSSSAVAAPVSSGTDPALPPFLQCVVQAESGGNYGAVSPGGQYMGAFQFSQSTWNFAAQAAGRPDLVGVPPNIASKADQDSLAVALYNLDGEQPWLGDRCSA
jgi:transglycosylase-like protein